MPGTVLCVDNDRGLVSILAKALGGEGYRVTTAYDGERALEAVTEDPPDLVLLDLILPRRDGFEVLAGIRQMSGPVQQTPVVLLTACSPDADYRRRAEALGAAALLTKPQPLERLLEVVARHAGEAKPADTPPVHEKPATACGELSGSLLDLPFPALLHHLHGMRTSGVLHLSSGRRRKWIEVRDGYPVAVRSNLVNECLGNFLVRTGRISHSAMTESRRRMGAGKLQGEILVAMEVVDEKDVPQILRGQAEEKLAEIFSWKSGDYRFELGARLQRANELALESSPANLILNGVRLRMPAERIDAMLRASAQAYLARGESNFYRFQEIDLAPDHRELLESLDGTRRVAEFLDASEDLRRILYALLATGMLELRGGDQRGQTHVEPANAAPPAPVDRPEDEELRGELVSLADNLRGCNYFEVLGVPATAPDHEIRSAYERLSAQVHPDRVAGSSQAVKRLASEVASRASDAYETLSDRRRRTEYQLQQKRVEREATERAEGRQALDAEMQFQHGEAALRQRDYPTALLRFGKALELYPEEGEYHAHYGWALHLKNPGNEAMLEEAIEHVRRGVKLASRSEKPYLFMGRLCKASDRLAAAEKMFTRAVQIQPSCVEALSELRLINMRREKGKGFVRRLLRR